MAQETRWTKRDILNYFRIKSWGTIWRWQVHRGFPLGSQNNPRGLLLFDPVAVKRWAKDNERPQYVKGVSTGERPVYNFPEVEPSDAAA